MKTHKDKDMKTKTVRQKPEGKDRRREGEYIKTWRLRHEDEDIKAKKTRRLRHEDEDTKVKKGRHVR